MQFKEPIIIDKTILDILSRINDNINILIITKANSNLKQLDITKFNKQYNKLLTVKYSNKFHDRFIIIDDNVLYHIGSSIKDLGNKCFGINVIEDKRHLDVIKEII